MTISRNILSSTLEHSTLVESKFKIMAHPDKIDFTKESLAGFNTIVLIVGSLFLFMGIIYYFIMIFGKKNELTKITFIASLLVWIYSILGTLQYIMAAGQIPGIIYGSKEYFVLLFAIEDVGTIILLYFLALLNRSKTMSISLSVFFVITIVSLFSFNQPLTLEKLRTIEVIFMILSSLILMLLLIREYVATRHELFLNFFMLNALGFMRPYIATLSKSSNQLLKIFGALAPPLMNILTATFLATILFSVGKNRQFFLSFLILLPSLMLFLSQIVYMASLGHLMDLLYLIPPFLAALVNVYFAVRFFVTLTSGKSVYPTVDLMHFFASLINYFLCMILMRGVFFESVITSKESVLLLINALDFFSFILYYIILVILLTSLLYLMNTAFLATITSVVGGASLVLYVIFVGIEGTIENLILDAIIPSLYLLAYVGINIFWMIKERAMIDLRTKLAYLSQVLQYFSGFITFGVFYSILHNVPTLYFVSLGILLTVEIFTIIIIQPKLRDTINYLLVS